MAGPAGDGVRRVPSPSRYAPSIGFSAAVRAGGWVHVAGTTAVDGAGEVVGGDDPHAQAQEALRKVLAALEACGAGPGHVVRTRTYLVAAADWEAVGRAHGAVFGAVRPASSMVVVAALLDPRMRVEIEADAYVGA
jgi:enamine deaminase RidA (YjgF/YER057c/UK114 family)